MPSDTIRARDFIFSGNGPLYIIYPYFLEFLKSEVIDLRYDLREVIFWPFYEKNEILVDFLALNHKYDLFMKIADRLEKFPTNLTSRRSFWPPWPLGGQNFKMSFFTSWVSIYMFFGSRNSKMTSVFDFDLPEVIFWPPWPLRGQNFKM